MSCSGKGYELDKDELKEKIDAINDMIQGMQVRMRCNSDFIIQLKKGLLPELAEKYIYKLDILLKAQVMEEYNLIQILLVLIIILIILREQAVGVEQ